MKKLLVATTNPGKLTEIKRFLADLPLELVDLTDVGITDTVEETGKTFEENSVLKAKFYAEKSGLPTISDDGGAEIDALGGEPGVRSHRWIHGEKDNDDEDLINYALKRLEGITLDKRQAQLRTVVSFALPGGEVFSAEGMIRGIIPLAPSPQRYVGFPFRSLLFLPELNKFYNHDQLTPEENERYNHRKEALEKLKPIIKKSLK